MSCTRWLKRHLVLRLSARGKESRGAIRGCGGVGPVLLLLSSDSVDVVICGGHAPMPDPPHQRAPFCLAARFQPFFPPFLCAVRLPGAETERTGEKWRKMGETWGRKRATKQRFARVGHR